MRININLWHSLSSRGGMHQNNFPMFSVEISKFVTQIKRLQFLENSNRCVVLKWNKYQNSCNEN